MAAAKQNEIQWLRALAALEVVIWHSDLLTKHFSSQLIAKSWYQPLGGVGVELFFIVSGYVICLRAPSYKNGWDFMWSRILRLAPMYWIFTGLVLLAPLINPAWSLHMLDLRLVPILESFFFFPQQRDPILGLGWSLEIEMIFYVYVAILMLVVGTLTTRSKVPFGFFLAGLALVGFALGTGPSARVWDFQLLTPYMFAFAFGWLARCFDESEEARNVWLMALLAAMTVAALIIANPIDRHLMYRMALVAAIFVAFCMARPVFESNTLLNRWGAEIGDASYSLYLSHWFVLSILGKMLGRVETPEALDIALRALGTLLCVIVAVVIFRYAEKPMDRWLRGRRDPRSSPRMWLAPSLPGAATSKQIAPSTSAPPRVVVD